MQNQGELINCYKYILHIAIDFLIQDTTAEKDINDVFEDLLFAEERFIEEGFTEGYNESLSQENTEAYHLGYHRGAEIGAEVGYYKGIVDFFLNSSTVYDKKITENLLSLNENISDFPKYNCENVDIIAKLNKIRAQFKKTCALLKSNHLLWDEKNKMSF